MSRKKQRELNVPPIAITPKEAAYLLNLSDSKVRLLCATGQIPATRVERDWKISYSLLIEWFNTICLDGKLIVLDNKLISTEEKIEGDTGDE